MAKNKSSEIDMEALFKRAAEIASNVPESMQDAAFNRALDILMREEEYELEPNVGARKKRPGRKPRPSEQETGLDIHSISGELNRTKYPMINSSLKVLERSMYLLKAVRDDVGVDGLTAPQIAELLTDKFRIPTSRQAVSGALSSAGNLVDRTKKGKAFLYRIMEPGERHLTDFEAKKEQPEGEVSKRVTRKRKAKATQKPSKSSKVAGRPGPKAALEELVKDGYFDDHRRIVEIKAHLESSIGYSYSAQELSPSLLRLVRDGKLSRERGEDRQYEYFHNPS